MSHATVKTRILIISDTHCASLTEHGDPRTPSTAFKAPLPKADLLIHCGDLTHVGEMEQYHVTLDMLKQIDAPVKLVIAGNHDLSLDRDFVFAHRSGGASMRQPPNLTEDQADARVNAAWELWSAESGRARREGVTFLNEGVHRVPLPNGAVANIYASQYTPEFFDWAFPYERHEDRFNTPGVSLADARNIAPYPIPTRSSALHPIDVVITHGPPWLRLDPTKRGDPAGCPHLLRALMRARPLVHCFGHIHEGWGAERVRWAAEAEDLQSKASTIAAWKDGGWRAGIADGGEAASAVRVDEKGAQERHAAYVDVSAEGGSPVRPGEETLLINAAIMDVTYKPANAPWLVDVDLPAAS